VGPDKPFELREFELPSVLREGEVLVKVHLASICGSDLHTAAGKRFEDTPLILGHEGVGTVVGIGKDIMSRSHPNSSSCRVREGDRITWSIADSCGRCVECNLHKLPQKCGSLMKYGHRNVHDQISPLTGTYATHIVLRRGTAIEILPDGVTDRMAVPANCALATVSNSLDRQRLPRYGSNKSAVIQGAGLLGIYAVAWLKKRIGMDHVFCIDVNQGRLNTAARFGAIPLLIDPSLEAAAAEDERRRRRSQIERVVGPQGVDIVVEMTGARAVLPEGVELLRNGGHYAFCGMVHPDSNLSALTGEQIIRKCLTIRGVHNYAPWNLSEAVEFLSDFKDELPLESVVDPVTHSLENLDQAFKVAQSGEYCRVAVDCS